MVTKRTTGEHDTIDPFHYFNEKIDDLKDDFKSFKSDTKRDLGDIKDALVDLKVNSAVSKTKLMVFGSVFGVGGGALAIVVFKILFGV
jgi:hypothetical protein